MSNKQCIEEAKKIIKEIKDGSKDHYTDYAIDYPRVEILEKLVERIEKLPADPSWYDIAYKLYNQFVEENPYRTNFRE